MPEIALWAATVELLGLVALPPLRSVFGRRRRDAALLSRPVGLALVAWGGWALSLLPGIPFSRRSLLIAGAILAGISWTVNRRARHAGPETAAAPFWGKDETRGAIFFWAPAAVFLFIRACFPEILGQEKFMDLAFLSSLTRNPQMPPLDPWMSGLTINYYYWGYLLSAALVRLSGVATMVGYNLLIATFAGYSFCAAACLGFRLSTGRLRAAIASGFAAVFAGNLAGAFDAWKAPFGRGFDYWQASRVIGKGNTINEFPFFTFFQADLHPHLVAFPYFLAAFAIGSRVLEIPPPQKAAAPADPEAGPPAAVRVPWRERVERAWPFILLAFLAGTARAANNWTLPAVAILIVSVCVLRTARGGRLPSAGAAAWAAILGAGLVLLSLVLWYPYSSSYHLPNRGLGEATQKSGLIEFLLFWGLLFAAALVGLLPRTPPGDEAGRRRRDLKVALGAGASLLAALLTGTPALIILAPLILLAGGAAWSALREKTGSGGVERPEPRDVYTGFLLLLSLCMIAGCEFIFFKDNYGTDLQRMNTIFKFYHQAWPLLAVAAAVLGERAWSEPGRFRAAARGVLGAAIVLALLYPVDALLSRLRIHEGPFTLDARAALLKRSAGDATAIDWLSGHAPLNAVVLEATGDPYSELSRISSHTGIPTVIGWGNHEGLWRENDREIADRVALTSVFYTARDEQVALLFLQRYKVTHVVLGDIERKRYPTADRVSTYPFLSPVFPEAGRVFPGMTAVYEVHAAPAGALPPALPRPDAQPPPVTR